jgi:hypothetical protein
MTGGLAPLFPEHSKPARKFRDRVHSQLASMVDSGRRAMKTGEWYELRVTGSAGTAAGIASGADGGIAVGENGRLCSVSSGGARRFDSPREALDYLGKIKVSGDYQFEPVKCGVMAAA